MIVGIRILLGITTSVLVLTIVDNLPNLVIASWTIDISLLVGQTCVYHRVRS